MRADHLPDDRLTVADVPAPDDPLPALLRFGHGYHAYKVAGSLPRVGAIAVELHDQWRERGGEADDHLDAPLPRLRIALFHTVRALDHGADRDTAEDDATRWVRVLVRSIRARLADAAEGAPPTDATETRPPDDDR